jgi:hypothetical protein
MAQPILNIVSEDPEVPHVADQVEPAAVQKHRGDERNHDGQERQIGLGPRCDCSRYDAVLENEGLQAIAKRQFVDESGYIADDQRNRDDWS